MKYRYINKKTFIKTLILLLLIIGIVFYLISSTDISYSHSNPLVIILGVCIIIISIAGIISEARIRSFSLSLMFWMFNFLFMGLAPLIQYMSNWRAWGLSISDNNYIECQVLVIIWMASFHIGKRINYNGLRIKPIIKLRHLEIREVKKIPSITIQLLIVVYLIALLGDGLFFKGAASDVSFSNQTMYLLNHHFFRNMVYYLTIIQIIGYRLKKKAFVIVLASVLLFFIGCFPLGISRYMLGSFYLGFIIICLGKNRLRGWFPIIFLLSLMIVFPVSNMFRFSTALPSWNIFISNASVLLKGTYNTGNYDAFHMFSAATDYVGKYGFSYGFQLLGALLFFIPRAIWPTKPVGTGEMVIIGLKNASFSNVSMPLIGEAYINFGVVGIVLFGLFTGAICEYIDKRFWAETNMFNTLNIVYPSVIMYFFFFNRGDMLSAGSYMIANIVVGIIAIIILTKRVQIIIPNNGLPQAKDSNKYRMFQ